MSKIVILSGSPSESSRSETILTYLATQLKEQGFAVKQVTVRDVPQEVLFDGLFNHAAIQEISSLLYEADGVIVGSPVYKAAYTGVLKALIDLLPQDVLKETPVLPMMVGGSPNHLLAIEYSLKPLLAVLKGQCLQGVYLNESQIDKENLQQPILDSEVLERLTKQVDSFVKVIGKQKEAIK